MFEDQVYFELVIIKNKFNVVVKSVYRPAAQSMNEMKRLFIHLHAEDGGGGVCVCVCVRVRVRVRVCVRADRASGSVLCWRLQEQPTVHKHLRVTNRVSVASHFHPDKSNHL